MNFKVLLFSFGLLLASFSVVAQGGPPHPPHFDQEEGDPGRRERIEQARQNFLQEEMGLTDAEAKKFFAVMKDHEAQMRELAKTGRREHRDQLKRDDLTEAEARQLIEQHMEHESAMLRLRQAATDAYLKVIPATKLVKLEPAKRAFRRKLLDRVQQRRRRRN